MNLPNAIGPPNGSRRSSSSEGVTVDPATKEHLWSALSSLSTAPRRRADADRPGRAAPKSQALKQALAPYCIGGPFGRLLDAEVEHLGEASFQAFETEGLTGSAAAPAVLSYLFHRIEGRLDGSPTMIIIDEGWLVLDSPAFAAQLREWLKTLRKKNASVVFATQSLADIESSAIAPAIIESCPTRIFLPNERAVEPQILSIYRRFGLNDRQIEIVARATPKRDYYCQSARGNRLFELGLGEVALAYTATSSKTDQLAIAELTEAHGHGRLCGRLAAPSRPRMGRRHAPGRSIPFPPPNWANPRSNAMKSSLKKSLGIRQMLAAGAAVLSMTVTALVPAPAYAQFGGIVYDPSNYSQNILTAARTLEQINNQIRQLQNQATSLINEARNLASLPTDHACTASAADPADPAVARASAAALRTMSSRSRREFARQYKDDRPDRQPAHDGPRRGKRWRNSVAAFEDALKVQAGAVSNIEGARTAVKDLVTASQSATGALQAAQAGNQLLALQSQQLADLTASVTSLGRAQSLDAANSAAAKAQAREQLRRFLAPGRGYVPTTAQMFRN